MAGLEKDVLGVFLEENSQEAKGEGDDDLFLKVAFFEGCQSFFQFIG